LAISTERLTLIPFTRDLIQLAMRSTRALGRALDARVPAAWPGPDLEEILPFLDDAQAALPARGPWITVIMHTDTRVLIGSAGFKDLPDEFGAVEIGYGLIPAYRGQGYATEAARALIAWAATQPRVRRVTAECLRDNEPSIRVLERLGMRRVGRDGDLLQWELLPDAAHGIPAVEPHEAKGDRRPMALAPERLEGTSEVLTTQVRALFLHGPHPTKPGDAAPTPMIAVERVEAVAGKGLRGDRRYLRATRRDGSENVRQVSLIDEGTLRRHEARFGPIPRELVKSQVVLAGDLRLPDLIGQRLIFGEGPEAAVLQLTILRLPCFAMDLIAPGLREAMENGEQGALARVLTAGVIAVGQPVSVRL
jgi:RimJ/RimL family protein N-acetyltransferase